MTNVQGPVTEAAAVLNAVPGVQGADKYVDRHTFELQTIVDRMGTDISLWDLGGGLGVFALAAQKLGMRATVVDDFYDLGDAMEPVLATLADHDVQVVRSELPAPLDFDQDIDVVTSFHTIEHLHNSPRDLYKQVAAALAPGGLFVIAGPNAVNLRKRLTVPFGKGEWSPMSHWYEPDRFRGHVREPRVEDFEYIARDLGLKPEILGQNFLGKNSGNPIIRTLAEKGSPLLERRPSLCSDLYLFAHRP